MQLVCTIVGDGRASALPSLMEWLRGDPGLGLRAHLRTAPPAPGTMGAVTDSLVVSVGAGGAAAVTASAVHVLASALRSWLLLPQSRQIRLRVEGGTDGRQVVEITAGQVRTAEIEALLSRVLGDR